MTKTGKLIAAGAMLIGGVYLCRKNKEDMPHLFKKKDDTDTNDTTTTTEGVAGMYNTDQIIKEEMNAVYNRRTF